MRVKTGSPVGPAADPVSPLTTDPVRPLAAPRVRGLAALPRPVRPFDGPVTVTRVRLPGSLTPRAALLALRDQALPFALTGRWAGGGAILGANPLIVADPGSGPGQSPGAGSWGPGAEDPFAILDDLPTVSGVGHTRPPEAAVGGGWFGWLGYRLAALVEHMPLGPPRPVAMPEYHLAYYDHVLRLDPAGRWWFEALASPERGPALQSALEHSRAWLAAAPPDPGDAPAPGPLRLSRPAASAHLEAVRSAGERIHAGEIFQANICLRLETDYAGAAPELFARALSRITPAYGAMFDTPQGAIASLSPELFLRRRGQEVMSAPIKGTIRRPGDPAADSAALARLLGSGKDAAEHVMIVDLMRNDLGRVCAYGSVRAALRPAAERHPGLWHLISPVRGRLRPGVGNAELLRATFPPGSVTGAPKVQSLRVIAELEASAREVYTGAIGFASPVAGLELSVAIRTLELAARRLWLGVGGGIVADSDPRSELDEALLKAAGVAVIIGSSVAAPTEAAGRAAPPA